MKRNLWIVCLVVLFSPALAMSAPSSEQTRAVLDHYWHGETPVLVNYKICSEIVRDGDEKNNCVNEVDPSLIKAGEKAYLWMNFMVPRETAQNISVLIARNNRPEKTKNLSINGSLRYRTWAVLPTAKVGNYSLQVDHEENDTYNTLQQFTYRVTE